MRFRRHQQAATVSTLRLLALFGAVLLGLLAAVNGVLALIYWLTFPFARSYPALFFETNTGLVLLFVLGGCWVESLRLREGGVHVARLAGGREAQMSQAGEMGRLERRLANVVQEMAIASGHDGVPAAWVLPKDDAINAFAAGWGGGDAVVAVTRGSLERLTRAELQGVVAHEFSHLVHGDTRLNMRLIGLVWGLQMVWGLGVALWEPSQEGRRGPGALFGLGLMAVGSLGWAAGRLLQAAVSRQREFLADASAVKYTRAVDGLGGALRKIAEQQAQQVRGLHSAHAASLAHLLLAHRARQGWAAWWQTHPPLAERLQRLYGREVLALDAPVLTMPEGEDAGPPRLAAAAAPAAGAIAAAPPGPPAAPGNAPQAHRHDAMQLPSSFDRQAREAEALDRIGRWHGPGEWQAAMLALALQPDAVGAEQRWQLWRDATADLNVAPSVRLEIEALGPGARRQVLALLLQRAATLPAASRRRARVALLRRWQALPDVPALAWRALAMALLLDGRAARGAGATRPGSLAQLGAAAHAATRQLAMALDAEPARQQAWHGHATQALVEMGATPLRGPARGLAPQTVRADRHLALRVRRLSAMQRPLLLRAWLLASQHSGLATHSGADDALHLACLLLALPMPPQLLGASVQERNL